MTIRSCLRVISAPTHFKWLCVSVCVWSVQCAPTCLWVTPLYCHCVICAPTYFTWLCVSACVWSLHLLVFEIISFPGSLWSMLLYCTVLVSDNSFSCLDLFTYLLLCYSPFLTACDLSFCNFCFVLDHSVSSLCMISAPSVSLSYSPFLPVHNLCINLFLRVLFSFCMVSVFLLALSDSTFLSMYYMQYSHYILEGTDKNTLAKPYLQKTAL